MQCEDPLLITYFKRLKMEVSLKNIPPIPKLPRGFFWVPWDPALVDAHAEVHFDSFCESIDLQLFPCFGDWHGCRRLLRDLTTKSGFCQEATWLIACADSCCGTIQAARKRSYGNIHNIGVIPKYRQHGIGMALILRALHGFKQIGLKRAILEVTAENTSAIRLYQRLGFRKMKVLYKMAPV